MDCFGTYFTYAQSCDNLRVQSSAEWTASVQNQTTRKREHFLPFSSFCVSIFLCFSHLRASLIASAIIDCSVFLLSAKTAFLLCAFSRFCRFRVFAVFAFSFLPVFVLGVSAVFTCFRVFAFSCSAGGIPAAGTQISCAQPKTKTAIILADTIYIGTHWCGGASKHIFTRIYGPCVRVCGPSPKK